jgi:hypothetical protein
MLSAENTTDQRASLSNIDDVTARGDATRRDAILSVARLRLASMSRPSCSCLHQWIHAMLLNAVV